MVHDQAHQLARALKASREYKEFKAAQEKLEQNETSLKIFLDLQAKQLELQTTQMSGKEVSPEKKAELEKIVGLLEFHPTVQKYLQAEYQFFRIMEDVHKIVSDTLDLRPLKTD